MAIKGPTGNPIAPGKQPSDETTSDVSTSTPEVAPQPRDVTDFSTSSKPAQQIPGSLGLTQSAQALAPTPRANSRGNSPLKGLSSRSAPTPPNIVEDAKILHQAMKGLGTDEDAVYAVFENRSPDERRAIEAEFNRRFTHTFGTLRQALRDDFSGAELQRSLDGLNAGRSFAPKVGSPEFEQRLDALTGSQQRLGNSYYLLLDGKESFATRNELIENATDSIYLQTFIFNDDETGWNLARLLSKRAQEGLDVRVIYDGIGSLPSEKGLFDYMAKNGVQVLEHGFGLEEFWDVNDRWHEKHLIVDQQVSIEGGMNIGNEYAFGGSGRMVLSRSTNPEEPWRDIDIKLEGPVVQDTLQAFAKNWATLGGPPINTQLPSPQAPALGSSDTPIRFVQHRPDEDGDDNTRNLHLQTIRSATESITIETAYFLPPADLYQALINAAHRGVQVRIMTNSRETNDFPVVSDAAHYFYDDLLKAGAEIYEKHGAMVHSKTLTVDGSYSLVGSVNLNGRSQWRDSESVAAVSSDALAQELEARFASGLKECEAVSLEKLNNEPFLTNLKQWAISLFAGTM